MDKNNKKKTDKLGMNHGTASGRLKKEIIFHLVKNSNLDVCFRCGLKIESSKHLSIDHKVDWLNSDRPRELFFDLENISFSHLKCNVAAASKPSKKHLTKEGKQQSENARLRAYMSTLPMEERKRRRRINYLRNNC